MTRLCFAMLVLFTISLTAQSSWAEAPESSLRPMERPEAAETPDAEVTRRAPDLLRPPARPDFTAEAPEKVTLASSGSIVHRSLRPMVRPEGLKRPDVVKAAAVRTQPAQVITEGKAGSLCGIPGIKGVTLAPIPSRINGCGIDNPVRVASVDGAVLTTPSIMDCATAQALNTWVVKGVRPSVGRLGGGVAGLKVAAHYACRSRNNQKGAKISEHGRGRAIDISAILLKNGASMSVASGWGDATQGKVLRAMHQSACGPFGTVLGPDANRFHKDHFHFDTARYRSGSYCR